MVALWLPTLTLSPEEQSTLDRLINRLQAHQPANNLAHAYYRGEQLIRDLGIAIPPELKDIEAVVGWPGTAVDVLEERLDLLRWATSGRDDYGLGDVFAANKLGPESSMAHLDSLIYGVSFCVTGTGDTSRGEPEVLVTFESPTTTTVEWSTRARRVTAGLIVDGVDEYGQPESLTLKLPDESIRAEKVGNQWSVVDRDPHRLGVVTVSRGVNRPTTTDPYGRSEITRAVRSLTDHAVRTLLGVEVAREFFAAPQRWVMGADESSFVDANGNPVPAWQSYLGRILSLSPAVDEHGNSGEAPTVGQFPASSPAPFWEGIRSLAQLFSAEAAIPVAFLGIATDNPPSADGIKALESRLLKRAERRQDQLGAAHMETAAHIVMVQEGSSRLPDRFWSEITCQWRDPSTPTRAAAADAAAKLVGAGVLPADSSVTWDLVGLSPQQQARLAQDLQRARTEAFLTQVDAEVSGDGAG